MRKHRIVFNAYDPRDVDAEIARLDAEMTVIQAAMAALETFALDVVQGGHMPDCWRSMQRGSPCSCIVAKAITALAGKTP